MITRHGFARHSVDARRRVQPAAAPDDGSADTGGGQRFRRGGQSRSTLPPSLVGARSGGDGGGGNQITAPRRGRVVFTDVDVVVLPNRAAASSPNSSGSVAEVEGHRVAQMSQSREQRGSESAVGRRSTSSMISRLAPPSRSSKSKSSSQSSADKRPTPSAAAVGCSEQAKKGERLSNYNKGSVPPTRLRPSKSPPPVEVVTTAWTSGVSPPPLNSRPWQSTMRPCGSPAMDTLAEELIELPSTANQPRVLSKNSPKHRSKQLEPPKLNSPNLRPRTQSMPAGHSPFVVGSELRPSKDGCSSPQLVLGQTVPASLVAPRHINAAGFSSSSDSNFPGLPNGSNGMIPGSPPGVWIPKLTTPSDNGTRNCLFQFHKSLR